MSGQKDNKRTKTKREFDIVMSGQFCTLVMCLLGTAIFSQGNGIQTSKRAFEETCPYCHMFLPQKIKSSSRNLFGPNVH